MSKRKKNPSELLLMGANPVRRRRKNPTELLLMGANPLPKQARERGGSRAARLHNPYDALSVSERLAFGRLGLGKAQLQTAADIRRARKKVSEVNRFKNAMPNPLPSLEAPQAEHARELYGAFHEADSERYTVRQEPHIPAGDYVLLGELIALRIKPHLGFSGSQVQEITYYGKHVQVICTSSGRQIYFACDGQALDDVEVKIFTPHTSKIVQLGICRSIVYEAAKWHSVVPDSARGKNVEWEHVFGDDGGFPPKIFYDRAKERLLLEGGSYHVEGAGIVN